MIPSVDLNRTLVKNTSSPKVRKSRSNRRHAADPRVRRTRHSAHDALISLARERPYDSIAVQDILNRADIARSTFYTHFENKNEVLDSGINELIRLMGHNGRGEVGADRIVGFSLPFLEHINGHRKGGGPHMPHSSRVFMHERLQAILAGLIAEHLNAVRRHHDVTPHMPSELVGRHVASTFVLVLNWWLDCEPGLTPGQVDARFRQLVLPILANL